MNKKQERVRIYRWGGRLYVEKCIEHAYRWTGKIPCTGIRACIFCGKPEDEDDE